MSALSILAEECELLNDSKYRSYITQVEKALKSFDSTSEWADLISALGKLNKVLLAHVRYPVIPKRVTIGKRLAQCLHPALPSGVHMKALETYDIIFKCIGTDRLAQDLFIYSAGLFPLLSYSAMNVKPVLLLIYEHHFVTLGRRIKPGLNGLLLGLLPGLEEGSEFYDQTDALLLDFCECTDPPYFYTCLWECVHSCPSVRLAAITFLMAHYNKKQTMEDQLHMVGLNISLMIEALCSAVQDSSVLVQRSMLDFLLVAFPLHNRQLTHADMARVVLATITVLLRRDMSLNRRFYAWLLGSNTTLVQVQEARSKGDVSESPSGEMTYFERYSRDLLVQALRQLLVEKPGGSDTVSARSAVLKPFRILISLLDKPEIGPVILESVLLSIFRCLCREYDISKSSKVSAFVKQALKKDDSYYEELLKTANLLFGTFEPYFIWDYASRKFQEACAGSHEGFVGNQEACIGSQDGCAGSQRSLRKISGSQSMSEPQESADIDELCTLVAYLLDIVSLETFSETQTEHLPHLLCSLITSLTRHCSHLPDAHILRMLRLCSKILSKVQPTVTVSGSHDHSADTSCDASMLEQVELRGSPDSKCPVTEPMSVEEALKLNEKLKKEEPRPPDSSGPNVAQSTLMKESLKAGEIDSTESEDSQSLEHEARNKTAVTRTLSKHFRSVNLMQQCIDCFQEFFHTLVNVKLLQERCHVQCYFARLVDDPDLTLTPDLSTCGLIAFTGCEQDRVQAFSTACQLLVEFASFPMYSQALPPNSEPTCMPSWVQDLVVCACYVDSFPVQCAAISALLDLIILNQSLQRPPSSSDLTREDVMSVQILPTLHFQHLTFLIEKTHFFQTSAEVLWGYLGDGTPDCHQTAVKLLYILHQVAPSTWVCEDVIGNQLSHHDEVVQMEAFGRFTTLWHLTRSSNTDVIPGKPHRNFHRSMFVLLDCLSDETSALRVLATTWLTHVIQQGDLARVMEPILQMLLHPDTSRVSVQHISIHEPRRVTLSESREDVEANIYAISNEGGNVIYHVNSPKLFTKKHPGTSGHTRSHAMTILGERGTLTASARSKSEQELHFDKVDPTNLSLRINPFGSESSIDTVGWDSMPLQPPCAGVLRAKRLDRETCVKEGIHFVGNDEETSNDVSDGETEESSERSEKAVDIAKEIIEDILLNVIKPDPVSSLSASDKGESSSKWRPELRKVLQRADSTTSSNVGDQDLLSRVQKQRVDSPTPSEKDMSLYQDMERDTTNIHSLHMHMLLYTQKYDYERTLYALSTVKAMLTACPRLMVTALVTTNISSLKAPQLAKLQLLLARHRKSVFGKGFYGDIPAEVMLTYRSSMFIEVLISVCLFFVRGYYPNLMVSKLTCDDLLGNKQVHILATETLTSILFQVVIIMKDSGKNFASYMSDLFQRCKVQKALLHCVLAVIYNSRQKQDTEQNVAKFTEDIVQFNEENLLPAVNETFLVKLLELLSVMISLEEPIYRYLGLNDISPSSSEWDRLRISYQPSLKNVKYTLGQPIVQQGMFVSGVLSALKQGHLCHLHRHWLTIITASLPHLGKHLPAIVIAVVNQLCRNIEALAAYYESEGQGRPSLSSIPPDHLLTMMESLMTLCHYCLLDNVSPVSIGQQVPSSTNQNGATPGSTKILSNLFNVFNPVTRDTSPQRDTGVVSPVLEARNNILSVMPRIMACLITLWRAVNIVDRRDEASTVVLGAPKVVRQYILEFISPISLPHGIHLLGAIAVAWNDRRRKQLPKSTRKVAEAPSDDQVLLVELVGALRVLPLDTLIHTVKDVLANPPNSELSRKRSVSLEVNMLQFFYTYVQHSSPGHLSDSWSALSTLLRDSLQINLNAPGQFLLLMILNEFVQKTPAFTEKRSQREVQELAQRLLEAVSNIAGSSLEQSTWLRKNYAVKPGPQHSADIEGEDTGLPDTEPVAVHKRVADLDPVRLNSVESKYSVQALSVLAEITAPLLDVTYSSEEKEKVAPFLITLLYNIFPYLRAHSTYNLPSLRAASQFVASISSYQYTRKAWRREALELLLDPGFFLMDLESIKYWTTIVDNLMTHDKTTYKDLMARVSMAQTGSLNLFTSREQEIDLKAGMLKRLAFTIFCSESDQYQKNIPEIQEKLAESLRVPAAPSVMAQVFLCFRVLMLRVSPQHLTSMWPTIITELIHVFLQIEQELSTETEEFVMQVQRIAALDSSWAHLGNGLNAHNHPAWLQLYLSACKLLDLCLALPADSVPQFQLYRWAFIGGAAAGEGDEGLDPEAADRPAVGEGKTDRPAGGAGTTDRPAGGAGKAERPAGGAGKAKAKRKEARFNPHIIRLARLLNAKLKGDVPLKKVTPGRPLITFTHLRSLQELQPFFNTLCLANQSDNLLLAARQLGANLSLKQSAVITNGHGGQNLGPMSTSQSDTSGRGAGGRWLPKSQSAPSFAVPQPMSEQGADVTSNKQFIEDNLLRDFLEMVS